HRGVGFEQDVDGRDGVRLSSPHRLHMSGQRAQQRDAQGGHHLQVSTHGILPLHVTVSSSYPRLFGTSVFSHARDGHTCSLHSVQGEDTMGLLFMNTLQVFKLMAAVSWKCSNECSDFP